MNYKEKAKDIQDQIAEGKLLDAFDKYYHDDVTMVEATGETRKGKKENRKFEEEFMNTVKEVHGAGVNHITADEDKGITMAESWMDVTFKDGKRTKMEQIARQEWKDGKVYKERFYYNPGSMGQPSNS